MTAVLYKDDFVTLTSDILSIHNYYFPTASTKSIPLSSIVSYDDSETSFFRMKGWGMGLSLCWWAMDLGRQFESSGGGGRNLQVTLEGCSIRCGFSVRNKAAFEAAFKPILLGKVKSTTAPLLQKPTVSLPV